MIGRARLLFEGRWYTGGAVANYDVASDGVRFLMMQTPNAGLPNRITVILHWFEEIAGGTDPD